MDRIRDARRGTMAAASVPNGGLSRRRQRTNSLRDSPGCYQNHLLTHLWISFSDFSFDLEI